MNKATMIGLICILPALAFAQITITSSDIMGLIGKSQSFESDTSKVNITVNVGTAGTNKTWDFRNLTFVSDKLTNHFIAPQGTPFAARAPQANFVQKLTLASQPNTTIYQYLQASANALRTWGNGTITPSGSLFSLSSAQDLSPLPLQYGASWTSARTDSLKQPPIFLSITKSTSTNSVDAWGVVKLSSGDYNCLRVRDNRVTISQTFINGVLQRSDTVRTISYLWVSKADFMVARVSSLNKETNPNFTLAADVGRLSAKTSAVANDRTAGEIPANFALAQNYPNPFGSEATSPALSGGNPETQISFQIARREQVELAIYNLVGQKVRTLVSGITPPGAYSVKWDGKDEQGGNLASGFYLYRLQAGNVQQIKRMLLLK